MHTVFEFFIAPLRGSTTPGVPIPSVCGAPATCATKSPYSLLIRCKIGQYPSSASVDTRLRNTYRPWPSRMIPSIFVPPKSMPILIIIRPSFQNPPPTANPELR